MFKADRALDQQRALFDSMLKMRPTLTQSTKERAPFVARKAETQPRSTSNFSTMGKLTDADRTTLMNHKGCFKCRHYYTNHAANKCTIPAEFQNKEPLSDASALKARPANLGPYSPPSKVQVQVQKVAAAAPTFHHQLPAHIVAQMSALTVDEADPSPSTPSNAFAAAVLVEDDETSSCVYSDDSDSYVAPFSSPQIHWACLLDGPASFSSLSVDALIDNGSSLVLIDERTVAELGLRRRPLPTHWYQQSELLNQRTTLVLGGP